MTAQHQAAPAVELPPLPPALIGQDIAEEFVSAVGWGVIQNDARAREVLSTDPAVIFDPLLQGLWVAIVAQAREKVFTWGLVRQRLLEGGMEANSYQNSLLVLRIATQEGYVGLWHIPGHRRKLEELRDRRDAWDEACRRLEREGVSQW